MHLDNKIGQAYLARKHLFSKGLKYGRLSIQEIEEALPDGSMTAAERWLLYYSLRAAEVEIVDESESLTEVSEPAAGTADS